MIHFVKGESRRKCILSRTSYEEFKVYKGNDRYAVYDVPITHGFNEKEIVRRAEKQLSKGPEARRYNLLFNNCESFANYCATGVPRSSQVTDLCKRIFKFKWYLGMPLGTLDLARQYARRSPRPAEAGSRAVVDIAATSILGRRFFNKFARDGGWVKRED